MNLVILVADYHGRGKEMSEATGKYYDIAFLHDQNLEAVGYLEDFKAFRGSYGSAFLAIGGY